MPKTCNKKEDFFAFPHVIHMPTQTLENTINDDLFYSQIKHNLHSCVLRLSSDVHFIHWHLSLKNLQNNNTSSLTNSPKTSTIIQHDKHGLPPRAGTSIFLGGNEWGTVKQRINLWFHQGLICDLYYRLIPLPDFTLSGGGEFRQVYSRQNYFHT